MVERTTPTSAPPLLGRDRELAQFADVLEKTLSDGLPRALRIGARAGFGKTAFLNTATRRAAENGWLVFRVGCHPAQERSAVTALRRLVQTGLTAIGSGAERYTSGLDADLAASEIHVARYEHAVLRLFEALLLDHAVLIAIDDAQWLDRESAQCIEKLLQSVAIGKAVLACSMRADAKSPFTSSLSFIEIALKVLAPASSRSLALKHYPSANDIVLSAVVERSGGIPMEIVTLAAQAAHDEAQSVSDVLNSVKTTISDRVHAMPAELREFLQLCSLVQEPIEVRIVNHIVGEERLVDLIALSVPTYIVVEGAELRFTHTLVSDAIRSTIPIELPLHKRILRSLLELDDPTLKGYDRVARHAAESGEIDIEYDSLIRLARRAFSMEAYDVAVAAFDRALQSRQPRDDLFVAFYNEYSIVLRLADRWSDARDLLEQGMREGMKRQLEGLGILAQALVYCIVVQEDCERAKLRYEQLLPRMQGVDRYDLLATGAMLAMELQDADALEAIRSEVESAPDASVLAGAAVLFTDARLKAQMGRSSEVRHQMDRANALIDRERSVHHLSTEILGLHVDFLENGCVVSQDRIPRLLFNKRSLPRSFTFNVLEIGAYSDIARGSWNDALAKVEEADIRSIRCDLYRVRAMCAQVAIAAFRGEMPPHPEIVEADIKLAIRHGYRHRALTLGFWWAAILAGSNDLEAHALVKRLLPWTNETIYSTTIYFPVSAFLYATRAEDKNVMRALAAWAPSSQTTQWQSAQNLLAIGSAKHELGEVNGKNMVLEAQNKFAELGASFFAAFAADTVGAACDADVRLLQTLGVVRRAQSAVVEKTRPKTRAKRGDLVVPTVREMQVAELVAQGHANRQIAEELVLSERTVEAHIANLFSKLGLSSRTQLTRWLMDQRVAIA